MRRTGVLPSAEMHADQPAERPVVILERHRRNDEYLFGLHIEVAGSEQPSLRSGGRLIGPEDAIFVSHGPSPYATPMTLRCPSDERFAVGR